MIESESSIVKFCSILFSELLRLTFSSKYKLLNLSIIWLSDKWSAGAEKTRPADMVQG